MKCFEYWATCLLGCSLLLMSCGGKQITCEGFTPSASATLAMRDMPKKSDIYYVSLKQFIGMKWGTANPIMMRDKDFGMIRIMGHGDYSFHVCDPALFMRECFGTIHSFKTDDIADYLTTS